jgi:phthalate 4,5-cis-dihydrodiol dehydrogenase
MQEEIGVGVVGYGRAGAGHMRAAQRAAGARLIGVAESSPERRAEVGKHFDCLTVADYRELLDRRDVQIITIALPHWLHEQAAVDAARAGKHILIEKPLAMEPEECDRINVAVAQNGVKLMVGHSQHYSPFNRLAKQHLEAGDVGELIFQTVNWYKPLGLASRPAWGMDRAKGGGMLQMNGAHMIDACRWFAGQPIVAVSGRVSNDVFGDRVKADDSFLGQLRFADGKLAGLAHVAYERGVETYQHDVVCTRGQMKVASYPPNAGFWLGRDGAYESVAADNQRGQGFANELEDLIDAIRRDAPVPVDGAYGREIVAAMAALEESTRTGREVTLGR